MSVLEDMEGAFMDGPCMEYLGDSIAYKTAAASSFTEMHAYVDYRDMARSFDGAQAIEQDIGVQLLKSDVPQKPSGACRITLGKLAGLTFKPVNVRSDTSGNYWEFEVVKVNA